MLRPSVIDKSRTKPDHAEHAQRLKTCTNSRRVGAAEYHRLEESEADGAPRLTSPEKEVAQQDLKASSLSGSSWRSGFEI